MQLLSFLRSLVLLFLSCHPPFSDFPTDPDRTEKFMYIYTDHPNAFWASRSGESSLLIPNLMSENSTAIPFSALQETLEGDLYHDLSWRLMYATDASVFREVPLAVCRPAHKKDLKQILAFCLDHRLPLIPRTAGTSLAGQVVGQGLVVDCSRYMNSIIELNTAEKWVRVQPGVILDDLNRYLAPHGLFFAPETSTSNRCMIGGMVANNACGSHSLVYGSTRDHTLEIEALLYDGSEVVFSALDREGFRNKCAGNQTENRIYRQMSGLLSAPENQAEIRAHYPDPRLNRRNTGYALDLLLNSDVFGGKEAFNFCKLLCGAEGTLAIYTTFKLNLVPLPPPEKALVCVHVKDIEEALQANLVALKHKPVAVELIDRVILDCTRSNIGQSKNRFFIQGDPGAIMVVEFVCQNRQEAIDRAGAMEEELRREKLGTHYPRLFGEDIERVWALRKAGLGLLSNIPGDAKPVAVIEDAAIHVELLPAYVSELNRILEKLSLKCVFFAHIGSGEIHIRPIVNLKSSADVERFYQVARGAALLVKKYRGSLSGEHGDGRLRAEFIPLVLGEKNAGLLRQVKATWDPMNLLNPGKIVSSPSMKTSLRYKADQKIRQIDTYFDYDKTLGFLRAVEQCNGSGDCRKSPEAGGVMCPSYHASRNEDDNTRGRANLLREFITNSGRNNPFDHRELINVLDLCLSCKGCKAECPSSVDMGKYKAETLQQYYDANRTPFRARAIGAFGFLSKIGSRLPGLYNAVSTWPLSSALIKYALGFAKERKLPLLHKQSLERWGSKNLPGLNGLLDGSKRVLLFCDEFTSYNDTPTGIQSIGLLHHLGYRVEIPGHRESGRAYLSKGLLKKARQLAEKNVELLFPLVSDKIPLIGIEPSAILCFRDEYPELVRQAWKEKAVALAKNCLTIDEFIVGEYEKGNIDPSRFPGKAEKIYLHGHCHQKALSSTNYSLKMLGLAANGAVEEIQCGCCGMAGAFGYEKNHHAISMQIGELSLFPAIRAAGPEAIIAAPGTSCRQQILDGTGRRAFHPAVVLFQALKVSTQAWQPE